MSRQNVCFTEDADVLDAHHAVAAVIRLFRRRGYKNEHAIDLAAQTLQITPRRAWALRYLTQPVRVLREQRRLLLHRAWSEMDRQASEFRAIADAVERQAEAQRIAELQLVLPLGDGAHDCSPSRTSRALAMEAGDGA